VTEVQSEVLTAVTVKIAVFLGHSDVAYRQRRFRKASSLRLQGSPKMSAQGADPTSSFVT